MLIVVSLFACTDTSKTDDSATTDTTDTTETTDDTSAVPEPVWEEHRVETASTFNGVYASGDGVYTAGTSGEVWVGGSTSDWTRMSVELDDNDIGDLWGNGAAANVELVVVATEGNIGRYAGGTWTVTDTGTANHEGAGGSDGGRVYAVSWGGIYRFDGNIWSYEAVPANARLNDVFAIGDEAIAVGEDGVALRRVDNAWVEVDTGYNGNLHAVDGSSLDDVWAVGEDGTTLHWDGAAWSSITSGTTYDLLGCFVPSLNLVYAVGNNGAAIRWDGTAWETLPTGVTNNLYAVHGISASNVWAVGNKGMALQFKDE